MSDFDQNQTRRAFTHTAESWYADTALVFFNDEILIGDYPVDGGTRGEFAIRWFLTCDGLAARIEAFYDSWAFMAECKDLFDALAGLNDKSPSPQEVCAILKSIGFDDITKRERP